MEIGGNIHHYVSLTYGDGRPCVRGFLKMEPGVRSPVAIETVEKGCHRDRRERVAIEAIEKGHPKNLCVIQQSAFGVCMMHP